MLKRNVGLWCAWAVYGLVDTCLAYLLGFSRTIAVVALRTGGWTAGSIFAWVMIFVLLVLIAVTVVRFGKKPLSMLLSWGRIISFTVGAVMVVRYTRVKKQIVSSQLSE